MLYLSRRRWRLLRTPLSFGSWWTTEQVARVLRAALRRNLRHGGCGGERAERGQTGELVGDRRRAGRRRRRARDGVAKPAPARTRHLRHSHAVHDRPDTFLPYDWFSRTSQTYLRSTPAGSSRCSTRSTTRCFESRAGRARDVDDVFQRERPGYRSRYGARRRGRCSRRRSCRGRCLSRGSRSKSARSTPPCGPLLGLLMCMSMMYPLGLLIKGLVEEKENKTQELMSIMGLQTWTLATAHAVTYAVLFTLTSLIAAGTLHRKVFPTTDAGVLIVFFLSFMASAVPSGSSSRPFQPREAGVHRRPVRAFRHGHAPLRVLSDVREPGAGSQEGRGVLSPRLSPSPPIYSRAGRARGAA